MQGHSMYAGALGMQPVGRFWGPREFKEPWERFLQCGGGRPTQEARGAARRLRGSQG